MTTKPMLSLADLDAGAASSQPFEFEYKGPKGVPTGVFLSILGGESPVVIEHGRKTANEARRKAAVMAIAASKDPNASEVPTFSPIEEDVAAMQRAAAIRLVGWRGIKEPYSPEHALALVKSNGFLMNQVLAQSGDLGNFMKVLSLAS